MKSILADFISSKIAVLISLEALNFDFWKDFILENVKSFKKSKLRAIQMGNLEFFWAPK